MLSGTDIQGADMVTRKKVTIYDIAAEIGASPSTVAAVLNGSWEARRIKESTAKTIQRIAAARGYSINMQARGLRKARSGLMGMIIPLLDNRFFSSLAQAFEIDTRSQHLCPVVVSTWRDPANEQATVRTLISHNVEALFLAGAMDPDGLSDICHAAGIKHVNVDLPGTKAPSVISDSFQGAVDLARAIACRVQAIAPGPRKHMIYFIGGNASDYNTQQRIKGFHSHLESIGWPIALSQVRPGGFDARFAEADICNVYSELGHLPDGLFVNSTIAFEGVVRFLKILPLEEVRRCAIGCFDWDPYIELLHFPVTMVRQNVNGMIAEAYRILRRQKIDPSLIIKLPTQLVNGDPPTVAE